MTPAASHNRLNIKELLSRKKIAQRALELWREKKVEIVDCYLIACLEKDAQNILYKSATTSRAGGMRKAPGRGWGHLC